METHIQGEQPSIDFLSPVAGWEAAARWNRATFDWMAKGWQQWVALMTTVPPHFIAPDAVPADDTPARVVTRGERALAAGTKRPARKARGKTTKTRARG